MRPPEEIAARRLRVLDLNTPWFWLVVFWHGRRYGQPTAEASLYPPQRWRRFWLHVWQREPIPDERGSVVDEGAAG